MFIETQTFRLPPGPAEAAFLDDDARIQTELMLNAAGLLRRTTARGGDGEWIVITLWRSEDDATAAASRARPDAVVKGYTALD